MADFVPLARWLRDARPPSTAPAAECEPAASEAPAAPEAHGAGDGPACEGVLETLAAELALLRVAACESFEDAVRRLLERLAREVLGRELALAPCDLGALLAAARAELEAHEPLCLVTAPGERQEWPRPFQHRSDPSLSRGDLYIEVRDGAFDASLNVRLRRALEGLGE